MALLALAAWVPALAGVRDDEIAQCLAGELQTWGDARDRPAVHNPMEFVYDHTNAPPWFDEAQVLAALTTAASAWSQCGVPARVDARKSGLATSATAVLVRWSDSDSAGNFGLTNYGLRTLVLGPAAFELLHTRNPAHDARATLQMVVAHEMGHLFGLMAHSRRCVDVTSNYDNGKGELCVARDRSQLKRYPEYRASLPTACDIARCKALNPQP